MITHRVWTTLTIALAVGFYFVAYAAGSPKLQATSSADLAKK